MKNVRIKKEMSDILRKIVESRKKTIQEQKGILHEIEGAAFIQNDREKLSVALKKEKGISIISEIKPASPTLGELRSNFNIERISREMDISGAVGLSVLTEPEYFNGSFENLMKVMGATSLPCLMKDFIVDEIQFDIAEKMGVKNILLINSIVDIEKMHDLAIQHDLEPLIEIHEEKELEDLKRLKENGTNPTLIGINNRDLNTLKINLAVSKKLAPKIKQLFGEEVQVISESGIHSHEEIQDLLKYNVDGFLIGTSIMKSNDIFEKVLELRGVL